jgi:ribosomal protein L40E
LADLAYEEALYDTASLRCSAGLTWDAKRCRVRLRCSNSAACWNSANWLDETIRAKNRNKSNIRARVEHVFAVAKRLLGFTKLRYRGLAKNASRAFKALALANIYLARHQLMAAVRP